MASNIAAVPATEVVDVQTNTNLVHALKQLQLDRIRVEVELAKEMYALELKYQDQLSAFHEKRRQIVTGERTPTEEECKYEFADKDEPVVVSTEKGIKNFWCTIFKNLDLLSEMVQDEDFDALEHLIDMRAILLDEPKGYRLEFEFSENKWFSNKVLTKTYYFSDGIDPEDPLNYENVWVCKAEGCTVDWKSPEVNLTTEKRTKKVKHRQSKEIKTIVKEEKKDSFFNFFDPPKGIIHEMSEEDRELMMSDIDIGETLRLNVIPRAVIYYTGEGIDDDFEDMDEEDYLDEDDLDDEDDDEEDDDDEDDGEQGDQQQDKANRPERAQRARRSGPAQQKQAGQEATPPECKQQ